MKTKTDVTEKLVMAGGFALGALAVANPVMAGGLTIMGVFGFGPKVYDHLQICERDERMLMEKEVDKATKKWEEDHTVKDPRTGFKWELKRPMTDAEKKAYSRRVIKENVVDILEGFGLI